jgi:hypothetical protein
LPAWVAMFLLLCMPAWWLHYITEYANIDSLTAES